MAGQPPPKRKRPFYARPLPITAAAVTLLVILATIPPLLASPTPVELTQQGHDNAANDDWQLIELGAESHIQLLGGLVSLESHALQKNDDDGYPIAGYTWATLKIPAMLPRDLVEDRLQAEALEAVKEILKSLSLQHGTEGILLDTTPTSDTTFTKNTHDTRLTHYQATARLSDQLPKSIQIDDDATLNGEAFIATWRCSILGSYALAIGVARDQPRLETTLEGDTDNLQELHDNGLLEDLGDLENLDEQLDNDTQIIVEEIHLDQSAHATLQQIQDRLLAQTLCA